jgi:beta-ketodecanoyl-[acyl-carrier-protein] synthase
MSLVALPSVSITGTGLFTPPESISNAELVVSLTEAVLKWNAEHAEEIVSGDLAERAVPDEEFILRASGIERRYVMEKSGVLDASRMRPRLETRSEDQLGIQAEMSLPAIHEALAQAGRAPSDVDAVIVGCSNLQRAYPAVAIEIQDALGADRVGLRHERRLLVGDVLGAGCRRRLAQRLGELRGRRQSGDHLGAQQLRDA